MPANLQTSSFVAAVLFMSIAGALSAQTPVFVPGDAPARIHELPPLRQQAEEIREWNLLRMETVLPGLMREYGVDMWILSMREYAEDPVFWSFKDPTSFAARRRSIYVFYDRGPEEGIERLALGGGSQGGIFTAFRSTRPTGTGATNESVGELVGDEQWQLLREIVEDRDPSNIVINVDEVQAFSDGLHSGEREALERALGATYRSRLRREPRLALNFIAIRLPEMMPRYRQIEETVHAIISQAFSNAVIEPGTTTTEDVVWWLREKIQELGMTTWFQPSVGIMGRVSGPPSGEDGVIRPGDVIWTDFGVIAMGLKTDTQHLGYVLQEGETAPPAGVQQCLADSNRLQDILLSHMTAGSTGNVILANTLRQMRAEGIEGSVYTHPIGDHGHGAGPLIGRWDGQEGVPGRGDVVLRPSTWHSIELQTTTAVPEWGGQLLSCRQEEEAYLDAKGDRYWVFRRQATFHLIW